MDLQEKVLFVRNVGASVNEEEVKEAFQEQGEVISALDTQSTGLGF